MKEIPLNRGLVALVDDEDFERIKTWNWYAQIDAKNGQPYAIAYAGFRMAREVMQVPNGDPREVDHRDHRATLDNRKQNLRELYL